MITELPPGYDTARYEDRGWPTAEAAWIMLAKKNANYVWPMIYDVGTQEEAPRRAPMHPDRFVELLEEKRFTSPKADKPLVAALYRRTVLSILGGTTKLSFPAANFGAEGATHFAEILPLCTRVLEIYVSGCAMGDSGCQAIAAKLLGVLPECTVFGIRDNGIGDAGCRALADAVRAGAMPKLVKLYFHGPAGLGANLASEAAMAELDAACASRSIERV